jgi:hypothetical protein
VTYVAPSDNSGYRRQQRRRAIVGWGFGILIVAGTIAAGVFGGNGEHHGSQPNDYTAYDMTQNQYEGLQEGLEQQAFVNRLQKVGLPENLAPVHYVSLFPPVTEGVECSFWKISDIPEHIARICFSDPQGRLVEKGETYAGNRTSEVESTQV